ncbi:MAG: hypothetical protein D3913_16370 [Candidatus Electrothrix sp. LOE1_4_5]|nr:hypothetical protein [Candidatus Electrothrix gigas]
MLFALLRVNNVEDKESNLNVTPEENVVKISKVDKFNSIITNISTTNNKDIQDSLNYIKE